MCGIAGFISNDIDRKQTIKNMTEAIVHRGPDAYGEWLDEYSGVTFGHRRLSIIDLTENGSQPMISASGRFVICYNGEIYDAAKLKNKLISDGLNITFRGTSDTEILLEAFEFYGIEETLSQVKGMFGIALYDRQDKCLYLMRDRVGEKSVYYGFINGAFVFGSEISALTRFEGFDNSINEAVIPLFLVRGYIAAPDTIYRDIYKLKPGQILRIKNVNKDGFTSDDIHLSSYWDIEERAVALENMYQGTFESAVDTLDQLLTKAIEGQMVADVPLGAYLSGGIDSATVVALMSKINPGKVKSFTIGFEEEKYNEASFAKDIAVHLGTEHTELVVSEDDLVSVIPMISDIYGEPFGDSSQIPTYLVSKLAKSKVTVSLSGDAGDELFCGYRTYDKVLPFWNKTKNMPSGLRSFGGAVIKALSFGNNTGYRASKCLKTKNVVQMKNALSFTTTYLDKLVGTKIDMPGNKLLKGDINSMMLDDLMLYHPDDILIKVDRAGMRVSLENRIPMLDKDVVEFALSLPDNYKYDGVTQKKVLKEVLYRYVPKEMMDRPKKGFSVPLDRWLSSGKTGEWAKELMNNLTFARDGYISAKAARGLWEGFLKGKEPADIVWNVLMLEQWYRGKNERL